MKRMYECMVLVTKTADVADEKKQKALIEALLKDQKDVVVKDVSLFGKRRLAYTIAKESDGQYVLAHIEASGIDISKVQNNQKILDDILRFLIVQQVKVKKKTKKGVSKKKEDK